MGFGTDGMAVSADGKLFVVACGPDYRGPMDLYYSIKGNQGWTFPKIMGVSTTGDERSVFIAADNRTIYFSSDGMGGFGGLDLYQFEMPDNMRPEKITYVKGKVYNAKTKEPLEASFEVFDLSSQLSIAELYSQKNGEPILEG
jgi:hypothetical protein